MVKTYMSMNRGDVWLIDLNPTKGKELRDPHPAVIINNDNIRELDLRIIVPITTWKNHFRDKSFLVKINANSRNGLNHGSAANVLQLRSVSTERFINYKGSLTDNQIEKIEDAIFIVLKLPFR